MGQVSLSLSLSWHSLGTRHLLTGLQSPRRRRGEERKNEELVRRMLNAEAEEIARTKTYPCPIWYRPCSARQARRLVLTTWVST